MKKTKYTRFVSYTMVMLLAPCNVFAFTTAGYWQIEDEKAIIEFKPCDEKLCGYLVFIGDFIGKGSNVKDEKNPVLEKRTRSLCNLAFITGLKLDAERYSGGTLYDPESGETYDVYLSGNGKEIKMRVYVGLPMLGETIKLIPISAELTKRCQS